MELFIAPNMNLGVGDADYQRFATLERQDLQNRWSSTSAKQILDVWKASGFKRTVIDASVGKLGGKLDLRGIPLADASLRGADLSDCDLYAADLRNADLYNANVRQSYLSEANLVGATLSWVKVDGTLMDNVKFDKTTKLVGIDLNGINTNFALHFLAESRDQQRIAELNERHPYFAKFLQITCDYGRSLLRWAAWTAGIIVLFGLIFTLAPSLLHHVDTVHQSDGLYFSVVTFTTLGFGDIYPITIVGRMLVCLEVIVGYLMGGVLIAILTKRLLG